MLHGCYLVKKSWIDTETNQKHKVTFHCDPNHFSQGKPWCDFAMVPFTGLDPNMMADDEKKMENDDKLPPG